MERSRDKQSIVDFIKATRETAGAKCVAPQKRIVTFDQDGTLRVEHPMQTLLDAAGNPNCAYRTRIGRSCRQS